VFRTQVQSKAMIPSTLIETLWTTSATNCIYCTGRLDFVFLLKKQVVCCTWFYLDCLNWPMNTRTWWTMRLQWHEHLVASDMVGPYRKECCGNTKIISSDGSVTSHNSVLGVQHCYSYSEPSYSSQWFSDESREASRPIQVSYCCSKVLPSKCER
jgi:hypothetical protein